LKYLYSALAAALLLVGCTDVNPHDPKAVQVEAAEQRAWEAGAVDGIVVNSVSGDIAIAANGRSDSIMANVTRYATGEDSTDAFVWLDSVVVTDAVNGGELKIVCGFPSDFSGHNLGARLEMSSPAGKKLNIELVNGNITIDSMVAGAKLDCVNSNVAIVGLQGGVDVGTVNGNVDCDMAALTGSEAAVLSTVNGSLVLSLPADVSATFDARTGNGTVTVSGFGSVSYTTDEPRYKVGTIGGGGTTIDLDCNNGNVTIRAR